MKGVKGTKSKKSIEYKIISLIFSFFILFLIIFLIVSNFKMYQRRIDLKFQIEREESEIKELSEKIKDITNFNGSDFDDDYHLEKIAREQLLLKKEGEEVILITFPEKEEEEIVEIEKRGLLASLKFFYVVIAEKIINLFQ